MALRSKNPWSPVLELMLAASAVGCGAEISPPHEVAVQRAALQGAADGVVELQLSYSVLFRLLERRMHSLLHEHPVLSAELQKQALRYHDTVVSHTRVGTATAKSGAPAAHQLLLETDTDVVVTPADAPPGSALQHVAGKLWIMVTPDDQGVSFAVVDGNVSGAPLDALLAADQNFSARLEYPALNDAIGMDVLARAMAHQTFGPAEGVIAFRFATQPEDDLSDWSGERISWLPEEVRAVPDLALLKLPGGVLRGRTASLMMRAVRSADDGDDHVTDGRCCTDTSWHFDGPGSLGPSGSTHTAGGFHVHWDEYEVSLSANVDITADVVLTPRVSSPQQGGNLLLGSSATIAWTTNALGVADGFISASIKEGVELPGDMRKVGEGDHALVFEGELASPPPAALPGSFYSHAFATPEGVLAALQFRPRAASWLELDPSWELCESAPDDAKLLLSDANNPTGPVPVLLYPVVVDPPLPVEVRAEWDLQTHANQLAISLAASKLPSEGTVTMHIVTDLGEHVWTFQPPKRPDPIEVVSNCKAIPKGGPFDEFEDCWMCGQQFFDHSRVVLPPALAPVVQVKQLARVRQ